MVENPYELDQARHDRIYASIARTELARGEAQEHPRAVITGGQPGSGKGGLTKHAEKEMSAQGGYVLVDPDELRVRHPNHGDLMRGNDREAADFTHNDASKWAKRLTNDAIEGRRNLIVDQTSKSPDSLVALTTRLKEAGYEVELRVIAVHNEISEQRIHTRYEDEKDGKGAGRFVPKAVHDAAYKGLPESVAAVEATKSVDVISVHDKHQKRIYENTLRDGQWEIQPPGARAALEAERDRPFSLEDRMERVAAFTKLTEQLEKRGAPPAERDAMENERLKASQQLEAEASRQLTGSASPSQPNHHDKAEVAVFRIDDMSTAAFEDLGRDVELGQVLRYAGERINSGEQAPFDLHDTNGNKVGQYEIVSANAVNTTPAGGAVFTVDLTQPAFAHDRDAQLAQYLDHAGQTMPNIDAHSSLAMPAADGQAIGKLDISPAMPGPELAKQRDVTDTAPSL